MESDATALMAEAMAYAYRAEQGAEFVRVALMNGTAGTDELMRLALTIREDATELWDRLMRLRRETRDD